MACVNATEGMRDLEERVEEAVGRVADADNLALLLASDRVIGEFIACLDSLMRCPAQSAPEDVAHIGEALARLPGDSRLLEAQLEQRWTSDYPVAAMAQMVIAVAHKHSIAGLPEAIMEKFVDDAAAVCFLSMLMGHSPPPLPATPTRRGPRWNLCMFFECVLHMSAEDTEPGWVDMSSGIVTGLSDDMVKFLIEATGASKDPELAAELKARLCVEAVDHSVADRVAKLEVERILSFFPTETWDEHSSSFKTFLHFSHHRRTPTQVKELGQWLVAAGW